MTEVTDRDKQIFRFLHALYIRTEGKVKSKSHSKKIATELDYDDWLSWNIGLYLFQQKMVQFFSDGTLFIAQDGVTAIELALADPDTPTERFAAAKYLILPPEESKEARRRVWMRFVDKAREMSGKITLEEDEADELSGAIETMQAQMNSKKPKQAILESCVESLHTTLGKAAKTSTDVAALLQEVPVLFP